MPVYKFGNGNAKEALKDLAAYPILTEEIGYPPSPLAVPTGAPPAAPGAVPLGQIAFKAVTDVLGWKPKAGDVKGFVGALNASFTCTEVEGHAECTWTPRTYAVQTDLGGGISGAQASVYTRAAKAVAAAQPLLDNLFALDEEADPEDIAAVKAVVSSQMTELVNELAWPGGPRVARVDQLFSLLLEPPYPRITPPGGPQQPLPVGQIETEPDNVGGSLGTLRDEMGLWSVVVANPRLAPVKNILINTVEEEQNVTNFRIVVDYLTSLHQSWINNNQFFGLATTTPFFGTQLVLLTRQMAVVADKTDEVRFTMDSVFITPSERQTLQIDFGPGRVRLPKHPPVRPAAIPPGTDGSLLGPVNDNNVLEPNQPLFVEDLLTWIQRFASEEGPNLIQNGGKYAAQNSVLPVGVKLRNYAIAAMNPTNKADLPKGYFTPRVQRAWQELASQLDELAILVSPLSYTIPAEI